MVDLIEGVMGIGSKIPIWEVMAATFLHERGIATKEALMAGLTNLSQVDEADLATFITDYTTIDPVDKTGTTGTTLLAHINLLARYVQKLEAMFGIFLVFLCAEQRCTGLTERAQVEAALNSVIAKSNAAW